MPVEMMTVSLKPSSFFIENSSNDVPRSNQSLNNSTLAERCCSQADTPVVGSKTKLSYALVKFKMQWQFQRIFEARTKDSRES